jgi:hypothetical protein
MSIIAIGRAAFPPLDMASNKINFPAAGAAGAGKVSNAEKSSN